MKRSKVSSPFGLALAGVLFLVAAFVGWLAVRATAAEILAGKTGQISMLVGGQPDIVLKTAMAGLGANRGSVKATLLPSIRNAAARVPLDARPYVLIGSDYLRSGQTDVAIKTLEAGRRLDPRQRWIHVLLLDHYLRAGQFARSADEFAVLARLVGSAQGPIATALAQMSVAPETREAVQTTLRKDAGLERSVLTALASSDVEPAVIFDMASPAALASANSVGGWGSALVDRLVAKRRYQLARVVWQRINRLRNLQIAPLLYDAGLSLLPGKGPFNWTLASNNIAAVDVRSNKFNVEYYGRDSGDLITQLLVLPPGNYRFSYVVSGLQREAEPSLLWSFACADQPDRTLAGANVPQTGGQARRAVVDVTIPSGCPAQQLRLSGQAGEFPVAASAVIAQLKLERRGA